MDKKTENLISLIFSLNRIIREHVAGHGKIDASSLVQLKILSVVQERGKPTMKEIAHSLLITLPSATSAINRLVRDGQINRIDDKTDRRIVRLEITDKGKKIYSESHNDIFKRMNGLLTPLDENEIPELSNILTKIISSHKK